MPPPERRRRWESLMAGVQRDDVTSWRRSFVAALRRGPENAEGSASVTAAPAL
jgi:trehalose-6-phosphate synthase